jgi:two-component system sensor histidine kinase AlgZ
VAWWLLRNLLVATVLAGLVLRYFFLQQQLRLREQSELQARLDALRTRIRPHFLFNTMNSIAALISSRPEAAEQVVEDLSELFRVSLQDHSDDTTVGDELRLCDLYLRIEQVRLGENLQVSRDIDPEVLRQPMPSLILQPLVENAVYHGISRMPQGGTIRLQVGQRDGKVYAVVRNPVPASGAAAPGHRMALSNIEQRLQGLFGDQAYLHGSLQNGEYSVELVYPREAPGR